MDFLDTKKERRKQITLLLGYGLVTLAIGGATLVLLYLAYGFNLNGQGVVTQNGLLFVSSQPSGSEIYLNGERYQSKTNTRVTVPAGTYTMRISRPGYRDWRRPVYVAGGDVQHFDYPFLIPQTLKTTPIASMNSTPSLATQSPDQRWLLVSKPGTSGVFTLYDFGDVKHPISSELALPAGSFTPGDGAQSWALGEWSGDSRHILLLHTYTVQGKTSHEYVLVDRSTPTDSVDLTNALNLTQRETLSLFNSQVSQYYLYNPDDQSLSRINAKDGSVVSRLQHVLAFKSYFDKAVLYVTDQPPGGKVTPGQVSVVLQQGQQSYTLRTLPAGAPSYVLNVAQYAGDWYAAMAASNGSSAYVYKNPQSQQDIGPDNYPAPWRRLDVNDPSYLAFSSSDQFLMAESGQQFVVDDLENIIQYRYTATQPLDQPQTHAIWMDSDRLVYVSGGKLVMFDYDYRNQQTLGVADAGYLPAFGPAYKAVYTIAPDSKNPAYTALTSTSLLTPADQ